jgi:hypothetical protein
MESQTNFMIYIALIQRLMSDPKAQSMLNVKKMDEVTRYKIEKLNNIEQLIDILHEALLKIKIHFTIRESIF